MKKLITILGLVAFMSFVWSVESFAQTAKPAMKAKAKTAVTDAKAKMPNAKVKMDLRLGMRDLWTQHTTYHRNYIISTIGNLGDVNEVTMALMKNVDEISNAIRPYYGEPGAAKMNALLKSHIALAGEVVKAAVMNKTAELAQADTKWKANADEIATFLSSANPNWPKAAVQEMLYKHMENNKTECVNRLKKDWKADNVAFEADWRNMENLADALSMGIQKQFPEKFNVAEE